MKKLSKLLLCLTLMLVSCFAMVGCGDTPPDTDPDNTPVAMSFTEYFGFSELTTYTGGLNCTSINDLSQYGNYQSITLYTKKDVSFKHISFKISAENNTSEEIHITIKFGTASTWNNTNAYQLQIEKLKLDCYYVKGSNSSSKYFTDNIDNPNLTQESYLIQKDTLITIYFGTEEGYQNYPANGEYTSLIKITDFTIE